jgi:hypothetical protein
MLAAVCTVALGLYGLPASALKLQSQGSLKRLAKGLKKAGLSGGGHRLGAVAPKAAGKPKAAPHAKPGAPAPSPRASPPGSALNLRQALAAKGHRYLKQGKQEPEEDEGFQGEFDTSYVGMANLTNDSNETIPPPPAAPSPPEVPRRPGPMQDDPSTNATGCSPFPCEFEEHFRPPIRPTPPLPPPRCGYYGARDIRLAWDGNSNKTKNLTISIESVVTVHVGYDPVYDGDKIKMIQPWGMLDINEGLEEYHDCREVNPSWLGYFMLECQPTVSTDPYSEDEFRVEWGLGNLTVKNASYANGTWTPLGCYPDTKRPQLLAVEVGIQPNDTQYITFGIQPDADYFPTRLPSWWLPTRCRNCVVPNPAYWHEFFSPMEYENTTSCELLENVSYPIEVNGTLQNCTNVTQETPVPRDPDWHPELVHGMWTNRSDITNKKPPWSTRVMVDPLPKGIPEGTQIINGYDLFTLRFDECVKATGKIITFTKLNPPPADSQGMKPRGYRGKKITMFSDEGAYVSEWCGNITFRPPKVLPTKNKGEMYEIDIPEGAYEDESYDFGPNPTPAIKFNFTVKDNIRPHVWADWDEAFYPMHGHTGRYPWHNLTIRFDENLMFNPTLADEDIKIVLDPRNDKYKKIEINLKDTSQANLLEDGEVLHINPFGHEVDPWTGDPLGFEIGAEYFVTMKAGVLQDWFYNDFQGMSGCDKDVDWNVWNGGYGYGLGMQADTHTRGSTTDCSVKAPTYPYESCSCTGSWIFAVATPEQMQVRKDIGFLMKWQRKRLNDTLHMFHLPTALDEYEVDGSPLPSTFKDSEAGTTVSDVMFYMGQAQIVMDDPDGIIQIEYLQDIYDKIKENPVEPKGYPFADDWVCGEFMSHMLDRSQFRCSYTADKRKTGSDALTGADTFFFREGCFCRVNWQGGCPYDLHHWPTYLEFGFRDMDSKFVTGKGSPMKFTENYLCWYWSHPEEPWWGYLGHPTHYFPVGDYSHQFECMRPRKPEQPCSTMRFWEWDIVGTEKMLWNKASAYHPKEIMSGRGW